MQGRRCRGTRGPRRRDCGCIVWRGEGCTRHRQAGLRRSPQWSPHRQEPVAPFKNATSREFRIPPPAGAGGFQFAGIDHVRSRVALSGPQPVRSLPLIRLREQSHDQDHEYKRDRPQHQIAPPALILERSHERVLETRGADRSDAPHLHGLRQDIGQVGLHQRQVVLRRADRIVPAVERVLPGSRRQEEQKSSGVPSYNYQVF